MTRVLILGAAALALSAGTAWADGYGYGHHHGHHYGYAVPVFEYDGNAYYGFPAPSYVHASWPIDVAVRAAPAYGLGGYGWRTGYWWR